MTFNFINEYPEQYEQSLDPKFIDVPKINFIAVRGQSNSNDLNNQDGEYIKSIKMICAVSYALKLSDKSDYKIEGYFDYEIPPLEGLWWNDEENSEHFQFITLMRIPEFVKESHVKWAVNTVWEREKLDCSKVELFTYNEGNCVQCLHIGPYGTQQRTIDELNKYIDSKGYMFELKKERHLHEIYISNPHECKPEDFKTIIRMPVRKRDAN